MTAREYKASSSEHAMQRALFAWADAKGVLMYANVNGQYRRGQRPEPGLRAGVPDVCVPAMRGGFGGLYLELKTAKGRVSKAQHAWIDALKAAGYAVYVVRSLDQAVGVIEDYLAMPDTRHDGRDLPDIDGVF